MSNSAEEEILPLYVSKASPRRGVAPCRQAGEGKSGIGADFSARKPSLRLNHPFRSREGCRSSTSESGGGMKWRRGGRHPQKRLKGPSMYWLATRRDRRFAWL